MEPSMTRTLSWLTLTTLLAGCHLHDFEIYEGDASAGPASTAQGRDPRASFVAVDAAAATPALDAAVQPTTIADAAVPVMPPPVMPPPVAPAPDSAPPVVTQPDASAPADTATPPNTLPPAGTLGTACRSDDQCASGACAAGICCNVACNDPCLTCRTADRPGLCLPAREKSPCAPATCHLGIVQEVSLCDGHGRCLPGKVMVCKSLACAPDGRCAPECRDDRDRRCGNLN
jgi:hypothetical protein